MDKVELFKSDTFPEFKSELKKGGDALPICNKYNYQ